MFGNRGGWGVPVLPVPLFVTVGGVGRKPAVVGAKIVPRDLLSLTVASITT